MDSKKSKAFGRWKTQIKATLDPQEQPHYGCTVRRFLYRLVAMTSSLLWKFVVQQMFRTDV